MAEGVKYIPNNEMFLSADHDMNTKLEYANFVNLNVSEYPLENAAEIPVMGSTVSEDGIRTSLRNASRPRCNFANLIGLDLNGGATTTTEPLSKEKPPEPADERSKVCAFCDKAFKLKSSLTRHMKQTHADAASQEFRCSKCNASFASKPLLETHLTTHSGPRSFICDVCSKTFTRRYHLLRHIKLTTCSGKPPPSHECDICGKAYTRKDNLKDHLRSHLAPVGDEKSVECKLCGKKFRVASLLKIHERVHTGEKPFSCSYCDKAFPSSGSLTKHVRTHTGEKPYHCKECDAKFSLKGTLNRHMRVHTGVRPHKCPHCDKEFIQAGGLRAHMFHHTGKNGFQCEMCNKVFNRKARLQMHVKYVHDKEKPFGCAHCNKCFTRKEDLARHNVLHSGDKPHKCPTCLKTFAIKPSLKLHMLTHTKEEPRACHECGRAFIRKDCLLRHMRKRHRNLLDKIPVDGGNSKNTLDDLENLLQAASIASVGKSKDNQIAPNAPYLRSLTETELCDHVRELLTLLVDEETLRAFGWPDKPVDELLVAVIKRCGHTPVDPGNYTYVDCLKENCKLLFTVVIDDNAVKTLLNNQTVDEVIQHVLHLAKT